MSAAPLGIVAGSGALPGMVARAARQQGREVFVLALRGAADKSLEAHPHCWLGMGELRRGMELMQKAAVRDVVLVGAVRRPRLADFRGDGEGWKFLLRWMVAKRSSDGQLLQAVSDHLQDKGGFRIIPAQEICESLLAAEGFLGGIRASEEALEDMRLGMQVARTTGKFDIGQGVVVCRGLILAVEAQEHTDNMLRRVADLNASVRGSPRQRAGVLVKLPKPGQSRALDWPVVGETTVVEAARAGLAGIALQAGGCLLADAQSIARRLDAEGMFLLSLSADELPPAALPADNKSNDAGAAGAAGDTAPL